MKVQFADSPCTSSAEALVPPTLVPPIPRQRRRALMPNWQAALQAATLFVSLVSLTMSSVVFMVLLYTPASGTIGAGRAIAELRSVGDLQHRVLIRLQREMTYLGARQKVLQSALHDGGLLTRDVQERLNGIERALQAKIAEAEEIHSPFKSASTSDSEKSVRDKPLIGRPDGHEQHGSNLIGRHDGHEPGTSGLIGRPDGHELGGDLIRQDDSDSSSEEKQLMRAWKEGIEEPSPDSYEYEADYA